MHLKAWDLVSGKETCNKILHSNFSLKSNRSVEIMEFDVPVPGTDTHPNASDPELRAVVAVYLVDEKGAQLARYVNWSEPLKYTHLQKPKDLKVQIVSGGGAVEISADVPPKGMALERRGGHEVI